MALPVISTTQSVLGYLQGQSWSFQPYATGTPTGWTSSPLPPGLALDATTGALSGAVTAPGVFLVALTAANADGSSAPVLFTIGIEAAGVTPGADIDLEWEVISGAVTLAGAVAPQGNGTDPAASLLNVKYDDDRIFSVRITKAGSTLDLGTPSACNLAVKDSDGAVLAASDAFLKTGSGDAARYRLHVKFNRDALKGAVADVEGGARAAAELELVYPNPESGTFGPAALRLASAGLVLGLQDNLVPA